MSRRSFDDGHQNQAHTSGFNLDFMTMHQLFHGPTPLTDPYADDEGEPSGEEQQIDRTGEDITGLTVVDDLGDLVDPQNDTYEEEGTHGLPLAIGAAAKAYGKFRKTPAGKAVEAKAIEKGTEIAGKAMVAAKDKLKGKGGAGLASPASEGVGTPDRDDPFA